ncbi:MAG: STAS domain-containing protein [Pirellulaceae bacterium]|nr:STAS domain-containing protein [Pirellulaceae bacterium]
MSSNRLEITENGEVTVVRFLDRKILDAGNIQEIGEVLFALVENENRTQILLNFAQVEFLSSAALNKLIILDKKLKDHNGNLVLTNLRPEIYEVFVITRLNKVFKILDDELAGLNVF